MTKEQIIDKHAQNLKSWVGTSLAKEECIGLIKNAVDEALILSGVSKRYDANKYTPPFRVGRKQGKAVLDGKGIEVVFFIHSEEQAKMYCDYLNNVC
jgi:hypothetical protein